MRHRTAKRVLEAALSGSRKRPSERQVQAALAVIAQHEPRLRSGDVSVIADGLPTPNEADLADLRRRWAETLLRFADEQGIQLGKETREQLERGEGGVEYVPLR